MAVLAMITLRDLTFEDPCNFLSNIIGHNSEAYTFGLIASKHKPAIHSRCQGLGYQVRKSQDQHVGRQNRTPSTVIQRE